MKKLRKADEITHSFAKDQIFKLIFDETGAGARSTPMITKGKDETGTKEENGSNGPYQNRSGGSQKQRHRDGESGRDEPVVSGKSEGVSGSTERNH